MSPAGERWTTPEGVVPRDGFAPHPGASPNVKLAGSTKPAPQDSRLRAQLEQIEVQLEEQEKREADLRKLAQDVIDASYVQGDNKALNRALDVLEAFLKGEPVPEDSEPDELDQIDDIEVLRSKALAAGFEEDKVHRWNAQTLRAKIRGATGEQQPG
jgi:hypothetical protein